MAERNTFDLLKRLFSTDVIIRNVGGDQLKVVDTGHIQSSGKYQTNSLVDRFTRLYIYNNKNIFNPNLNYQSLRTQLYADYEAMDTDPIIASVLDIIADEACVRSEFNEILSIKSSDENVQRVLYNLFYDVLNIEFNLWTWTRAMTKYGDFFLKMEISEKYGVYNVIPYTVYHMSRHEGLDPENPTKVMFKLNPDGIAASQDVNFKPRTSGTSVELENYEVAHFRLLSDTNFLPYGRAYIEPARKVYKQLTMAEDAALLHRIMRSPEKRIFYINVGSIPPNEVEQFMQKTINSMKKTPYLNNDGQYNMKFNMQNMMEDFYIPVRGNDQTTKVDTIKGLEYDGMADVEYLREKLFAALKVPKAFLGFEGELCIVPETEITLLNGKIKTVAELIADYQNGVQNYTYSINEDTHEVVPGKILWAGYTRKDAKLVRVHLDNGKYLDTTPDHLFMLRDGSYIEAQNLTEGTSLMPLYLAENPENIVLVKKVEILEETKDTCDLHIENHHNFGTTAGVFIHNSGKATLSSETVRFAKTVERIQRILESELTKIALVHLAAQGFEGENLTNFDLKLTTPSIIFEQEKIALLKEKVDLASQMLESNLFPTDYVFEKIFDLSEDEYMELKDLVIEDKKQQFRLSQIENEGNDPAKTGRSYGTPHDLASMYGRRTDASSRGGGIGEVPPGYEELPNPPIAGADLKDVKIGRPRIHKSLYGTNNYPNGGRDPLGVHGMKGGYPSDNENVSEGISRTERLKFQHTKDLSYLMEKVKAKKEPEMLNEENLLDLDN